MGGCVNPASQLPLATGASSRNLWPAFECSFVCSYLVLKRHQSVPRKGPTPSVPIFLSCGGAVVACDSVYRITEANDMSLLIWPRALPPPLRNFVRLTRRWPPERERERRERQDLQPSFPYITSKILHPITRVSSPKAAEQEGAAADRRLRAE